MLMLQEEAQVETGVCCIITYLSLFLWETFKMYKLVSKMSLF